VNFKFEFQVIEGTEEVGTHPITEAHQTALTGVVRVVEMAVIVIDTIAIHVMGALAPLLVAVGEVTSPV
jgi:hypothetical protein